ncbi:hypothetical protein JQ038_01145 [Clostridium botulinum]|nr:hypothetical protein [Clostridium botulinum]
MSKFFYSHTAGIDASADFLYISILPSNEDVYKKTFKIKHDINGFNHLFEEIKKWKRV